MSPARAFVLLAEGRTGSEYLTKLLDDHPNVRAQGERLRRMAANGASPADQLDWARGALEPDGPGLTTAGFKTKLRDVADREAFTRLLLERDVRVLHLVRRNVVKVAVSEITRDRLAEVLGRSHAHREADRVASVAVDLQHFDDLLRHRRELDAELDAYVESLELPVLRLAYEDLLVDRDRVLREVFDFLGVPPHEATTSLVKTTADDLRQVVANFDELVGRYRGTPYESMFGEVLVESPSPPSRLRRALWAHPVGRAGLRTARRARAAAARLLR